MDCFCSGRRLRKSQADNTVRKLDFALLLLHHNKVRSAKPVPSSVSAQALLFQRLQQQFKQLLKSESSCMKVSVTEHENKCIPPLSNAAVLLIPKMTYSSYISHHFKAPIHTERLRSTQQAITSAGYLVLLSITPLVILNCFPPRGHTAYLLETGTDLLWISKENEWLVIKKGERR